MNTVPHLLISAPGNYRAGWLVLRRWNRLFCWEKRREKTINIEGSWKYLDLKKHTLLVLFFSFLSYGHFRFYPMGISDTACFICVKFEERDRKKMKARGRFLNQKAALLNRNIPCLKQTMENTWNGSVKAFQYLVGYKHTELLYIGMCKTQRIGLVRFLSFLFKHTSKVKWTIPFLLLA